MDTSNLIRTRGIVLSVNRYKESSRIINIFTEKRGRINIFASGVLRQKSGLMLATEKFVESEFILRKTANNYYIHLAEIINSNLEISASLDYYFLGDMICELILKTMPEYMVDERVYALTAQVFNIIKTEKIEPKLLKLGYLIKYLSFIGFRPQIQECTDCSSRDYSNMYFSNKIGGIICVNCLENKADYVKLNKMEIHLLNRLLYSKFSNYKAFEFSDEVLLKVEKIIFNYMLYCTDIKEMESQKRFQKLMGI